MKVLESLDPFADLLSFEDLDTVGRRVGRVVGELEMGEVVGVSSSSPPPHTRSPNSFSPQTKPQHVPKLKGSSEITMHVSPKSPH